MTENRRQSDAPKSDKAYDKWVKDVAEGLLQIERYQSAIQEDKPTLTSFRCKCDPDDDLGVLVVAEGYIGSSWYVAFHRADTVSEAIKGLGNRLRNGSLKWRDDEHANTRQRTLRGT